MVGSKQSGSAPCPTFLYVAGNPGWVRACKPAISSDTCDEAGCSSHADSRRDNSGWRVAHGLMLFEKNPSSPIVSSCLLLMDLAYDAMLLTQRVMGPM